MNLRRIVATALPLLVLTGCTTGRDSAAPSSASAEFVDTDLSAGQPGDVHLQTIDQNDPLRPVYASWPHIVGADGLNAALDAKVQDAVDDFTETYQPTEAAPGININGNVSVQSETILAVTVDTILTAGASVGYDEYTVWSINGEALTSAELIAEDERETVAELLADAAAAQGIDVFGDEAIDDQDAEAALASILSSDDQWIFVVPSGTIAPESAGLLSLTLPADVVAPLLSESGVLAADGPDVQDETTDPAPTDPAAEDTPAPAPDPAPVPAPAPQPDPAPQPPASGDVDCAQAKCVALTFDDGPGPYTPQLLDILESKKAPATFFVVAKNIKAYPQVAARAAGLGMQMCNHTATHPNLKQVSAAQQRSEIDQTAAAYAAAVPGGTLPCLRPPYGLFNETTRGLGLPIVMWDVDTEDWKNKSVEVTTQRALSGARNGAIILMHDIHKSSVTATAGIIDELRAAGYTLVTVDQLTGGMSPGKAYYSRAKVN